MSDAPLDPHVRAFVDAAIDPLTNRETLKALLMPINQSISFALFAPFYGAMVGLSESNRLSGSQDMCESAYQLAHAALFDRPGWNDFLMVRWLITKRSSLIPEMVARTIHSNPDISRTAAWMITSTADNNPEFELQLRELGYSRCEAGWVLTTAPESSAIQ